MLCVAIAFAAFGSALVCCALIAVRCALFVWLLFVGCCLRFVVRRLSCFVVRCVLSVVKCLVCVVCWSLSVRRCLVFVDCLCCLLRVVCCFCLRRSCLLRLD